MKIINQSLLLVALCLYSGLGFAIPSPEPVQDVLTPGMQQATTNNPAPLYGAELCANKNYECYQVKPGDTWVGLWPNPRERDIVMRLNRTNVALKYREWIVVPKNLSRITLMDISPFPQHIANPDKTKFIVVDLGLQAFAAYNAEGALVLWGPATMGRELCPDIGKPCKTVEGSFHMIRKKDVDCQSNTYPLGLGGTAMPYCMFFYGGYALHGSQLPGKPSSHGCVGIFDNDARWLNQDFIKAGKDGTRIDVIS